MSQLQSLPGNWGACYNWSMKKSRVEAFSDGVIAIITVTVLELKKWLIPDQRIEKVTV